MLFYQSPTVYLVQLRVEQCRKEADHLTTNCSILWSQDTACGVHQSMTPTTFKVSQFVACNRMFGTTYETSGNHHHCDTYTILYLTWNLRPVPVCSGTVMCSLQSPLTTALPPLSSCLTIGPSSGSFSILSLTS